MTGASHETFSGEKLPRESSTNADISGALIKADPLPDC